jgi:hypothetical protein
LIWGEEKSVIQALFAKHSLPNKGYESSVQDK